MDPMKALLCVSIETILSSTSFNTVSPLYSLIYRGQSCVILDDIRWIVIYTRILSSTSDIRLNYVGCANNEHDNFVLFSVWNEVDVGYTYPVHRYIKDRNFLVFKIAAKLSPYKEMKMLEVQS